jgi:hypothetical protein
MASAPPRKRAQASKAQQRRDFRKGAVAVLQMALRAINYKP